MSEYVSITQFVNSFVSEINEREAERLADRLNELGWVKVVRCIDCRHLYETWDGYECERFSGEYHRAEPGGFCSWAERRVDDAD